jgi:hypothetical protein
MSHRSGRRVRGSARCASVRRRRRCRGWAACHDVVLGSRRNMPGIKKKAGLNIHMARSGFGWNLGQRVWLLWLHSHVLQTFWNKERNREIRLERNL